MGTPIHGRKGRLYVGLATSVSAAEPVANLTKWSIDFSTDKSDVTVFGDLNKHSVSGLPNAQGDFAGFYDTASAQLYTAATDGDARRFYLYPTTAIATTYWFGAANFDFKVEGSVEAPVAVSGAFEASSDVPKIG